MLTNETEEDYGKEQVVALQPIGPVAKIPKDPQPNIDRIDELARRILTGDILLPKFQRDFVWDKDQIVDLLDSVSKGYPIGSILLWQSKQALASEKRIAELDIDLPRPDYPVNYLLDGQQRLSAICGAIHWAGTDPKSRWNIAYDLRTQQFIHLSTMDDPPQHQIRVNKLAEATQFFKHVALLDTLTSADKADLKLRAETLFSRFKDYKIATVTLGDMEIKDVAPIFERINSTGTPLTIVDLMRAATWSPDFDLIDAIDEILDVLDSKGFGGIDKKVILRNLSAASGGGFNAESIDSLRKHPAPLLKTFSKSTEEAYRRAVDFLNTEIGIPGNQVIPYSNQLTVLAEVFRLIPTPTAPQFKAITSWFWKTSVSGYFSGWNTGMMASDLKAVRDFAAGTNKIDIDIAKPSADIWRARTFRLNVAHAKILAIVLGHRQPVDLLTGQKIDVAKALAWTNAKEFHHVFPTAYLKTTGRNTGGNSLANIIMLTSVSNKTISDRAPKEYFKDVEAAAGGHLQAWLDSNLISKEAYAAAKSDDLESFLSLRSKTIHAEVLKKTDW